MSNINPKKPPIPTHHQVGERVRLLMERAGREQKELAGEIHLDASTVTKKLGGQRKISVVELIEILNALGIHTSVDDLFNLIEVTILMKANNLNLSPKNLVFYLISLRQVIVKD